MLDQGPAVERSEWFSGKPGGVEARRDEPYGVRHEPGLDWVCIAKW
jgi:hypothetical protein